jgi:hypothetical protein
MDIKEIQCNGVYCIKLAHDGVHGNEPLGIIKGVKFVD